MTGFTYVSLFSGIGGFETALNRLGGTCVLASEIDKFANQSYEALYGHPTAGDITKIEAADVPDHDVLVGGFPCQAFSVAGKRGGFDDARGTLFFEVARLAKTKQPRAILLENVKGLVGHDGGKTLDTIVKTLNDIGYTVDFNVLNSKYFGVPQNRERIFIVAIRDDLAIAEPWIIEGTNVVSKGKRRLSEYEGVKTFNFDWPSQESVTTRLRDVLEPIVDERYYLSDDKTAKLVAQLDEGLAIKEASNINQGVVEPSMLGHIDVRGNDICKRVYSTESVSPTVPTGTSGNTTPKVAEPQGIEWLGDLKTQTIGKPKDYSDVYGVMGVDGVSQTLRTMQGGRREPKIAEEQSIDAGMMEGHTKIREDGTVSTVTASYAKGLCGQARPFVYEPKPRYRIRKLTPLECWRLQGFTDDQHQTVLTAGLSDSQRYKQAGNAVTVNVIEAIGVKLLAQLSGTRTPHHSTNLDHIRR